MIRGDNNHYVNDRSENKRKEKQTKIMHKTLVVLLKEYTVELFEVLVFKRTF